MGVEDACLKSVDRYDAPFAEGCTRKNAFYMGILERMVKAHLTNINSKLDVD